jgi:hypothetical protein
MSTVERTAERRLTILLLPSSVATWPKLAGESLSSLEKIQSSPSRSPTGLIEVVKHRDVFFVDSDVAFK